MWYGVVWYRLHCIIVWHLRRLLLSTLSTYTHTPSYIVADTPAAPCRCQPTPAPQRQRPNQQCSLNRRAVAGVVLVGPALHRHRRKCVRGGSQPACACAWHKAYDGGLLGCCCWMLGCWMLGCWHAATLRRWDARRPPSTSSLQTREFIYHGFLPPPSTPQSCPLIIPPSASKVVPTPLRRCLVQRFQPILPSFSLPPEHPFFFVPSPSPSGGYR